MMTTLTQIYNSTAVTLLLPSVLLAVFLLVDDKNGNNVLRRGLQEEMSLGRISRLLTLIDEDEELPPLFPFQTDDYFGFSLAALGLLLAAGGGIGGGGLLVPIYILVLEFPVKHAIPLASVTVFGGAIANNILNASKKHPDHSHRSCIDWELILQMEPATIAGALVGAEVNDLLPDLVIILMLLALLSFTAYTTLKKANSLYAKESAEILAQAESVQLLEGRDGNEQSQVSLSYGTSLDTTDGDRTEASTESEMDSLEVEVKLESFLSASKLVVFFVIVTSINMLKGGPQQGGGPFGLSACGKRCFWINEVVLVIIILSFIVYARWSLLQRINKRKVISSDILWDKDNTVTYPALAIVAGLAAGMFGIGGGIVKGPLMLALGEYT